MTLWVDLASVCFLLLTRQPFLNISAKTGRGKPDLFPGKNQTTLQAYASLLVAACSLGTWNI